MRMPLRVITFLALLSVGCVHEPRVHYVCQATLTNENGDFRADANELQWSHDLGDGMQASLSVPHARQSAEDFRAHGFGALGAPSLVLAFDHHRLARNDWTNPPVLNAVGEIRIGDQSRREWVSYLHMTVFAYSDWSALLAQEGDMEVVLFEATDRAVLLRGAIPRSALDSVESTLQRLSAETAEMELDPTTRCIAVEQEEEEVTITHAAMISALSTSQASGPLGAFPLML
jgi:hypothetical protein